MTFESHVNELRRKVMGKLIYLNRVNDRFDSECRMMVVESLILSVLHYGLKVWGSTSKLHLDRVQKLQNFAAKVAVGGARKRDHVTPILVKLEWLRLEKQYFYEICILVFKIRNQLVPSWLFNMPSIADVREELIVTRQNHCLFISQTRTDAGAKALSVGGPSCWNKLPEHIRNCETLSTFKTNLFKWLS